jgi:hypothetical protein
VVARARAINVTVERIFIVLQSLVLHPREARCDAVNCLHIIPSPLDTSVYAARSSRNTNGKIPP